MRWKNQSTTCMFQSTPDYLNRENFAIYRQTAKFDTFQSTPDYLNRENTQPPEIGLACASVSIHSRLFKPGECPAGLAT